MGRSRQVTLVMFVVLVVGSYFARSVWSAILVVSAALFGCGRSQQEASFDSTYQPVAILPAEEAPGYPHRLAFSPDSATLAVGFADGGIVLYDTPSWTRRSRLNIENQLMQVLEFSPCGRYLVASSGFTAHVWDVQAEKEIAVFDHGRSYVTSGCFSPDGRTLFTTTSSLSGSLHSWDLDTKTGRVEFWVANSVLLAAENRLPSIHHAATHDFKIFALALNRRLLLFDRSQKKEIKELLPDASVSMVRYSPDGRLLAVEIGRSIVLLSTEDWAMRAECSMEVGLPADLSFSPDGSRLVVALLSPKRHTGRIAIYEVKTGRLLGTPVCYPNNEVPAAKISPNGKYVATAQWYDSVKIWKLEDMIGGISGR